MKNSLNLKLFPFLLVFYEIATYLSNDMYLPALPSIAKDLKTTDNLAQLTFTLWFLGGLSVQLFLGPLSDRYGRRPILLWGGIIFIVSTTICMFAPNISLLLIGRYIQGAAVPSMMIAGYASIHELLERKEAVQILAKMQSITILAPSLGPILGSILLTVVSWRWTFGLLVIWACFALIMLYFKMPETLSPEKRQTRIQLTHIIAQYSRLLTNAGFMKYLLAGTTVIGALIAWMLAGPFLVVNQFNYNIIYFGLFQAFIFGGFILGSRSVDYWMKKYELKELTLKALGLSLFGGILSILLAFLFPDSLSFLIISLVIVTVGSGVSFPALTRMAIEESEEPMGARMSMVTLVQFLSAALAATVVSYLSETVLSLASMVFLCPLLAFSMYLIPVQAHKKLSN